MFSGQAAAEGYDVPGFILDWIRAISAPTIMVDHGQALAVELDRLLLIAQGQVFPHHALHLEHLIAQPVLLEVPAKLGVVVLPRHRQAQVVQSIGLHDPGDVDALASHAPAFIRHPVGLVGAQAVQPEGDVDGWAEGDGDNSSVHVASPFLSRPRRRLFGGGARNIRRLAKPR